MFERYVPIEVINRMVKNMDMRGPIVALIGGFDGILIFFSNYIMYLIL